MAIPTARRTGTAAIYGPDLGAVSPVFQESARTSESLGYLGCTDAADQPEGGRGAPRRGCADRRAGGRHVRPQRGPASVPNRVGARVDELDGLLLAMPGYAPSSGALVAKLVSLFPRNAGGELPTHQAVIAVFDPETGRPDALLDGEAITATRTGAGSALATRLLAREDATRSRSSARACRPARTHAPSRACARSRSCGWRGAPLEGRGDGRGAGRRARSAHRRAGSWEEACQRADVSCAATHATEPVVRREWLSAGTHVNSVGFNPQGRELDDATVIASRVAGGVPRGRAGARAGRLERPPAADGAGPDRAGSHPGRDRRAGGRQPARPHDKGQITLYKSVGVAVQDAVAAALVLGAARARGAGQNVEL